MSITRPIQLGAGYIINVFPDTDKTVSFYDWKVNLNVMIPHEAQFCVFVPNKSPVPVTMQPTDGCVSWSDDGQYAVYHTKTDFSNVRSCFRSRESKGAILDIPCCEVGDKPPFLTSYNDTSCLRAEGVYNYAQFNHDHDYLVYFDVWHSRSSHSGKFERLNPSTWKECNSEAKSSLMIWVIITVCVVMISTLGVAVWYYRKKLGSMLFILRKV